MDVDVAVALENAVGLCPIYSIPITKEFLGMIKNPNHIKIKISIEVLE